MNMVEEWRPVLSWDGYKASNLGRVIGIYGRIRKPFISRKGYLGLSFRGQTMPVHALVLEAFRCRRPEGMECRHLDGNKLNNTIENLAWGTNKENLEDRVRHGSILRGESVRQAKLKEDDIRYIRRNAKKMTTYQLSAIYGVTVQQINRIISGKRWMHVI